jgi:hypothetical protein
MRCPQNVRGRFVHARNETRPSRIAEPCGAAEAAAGLAAIGPPVTAVPAALAIASAQAQTTPETDLMITRRS